MDRFPKLKTGAIAQYPSRRELRYATETRRFLDATEQRYRDFAQGKRAWTLRLDRLTSTELAEIRDFFVRMKGRRTAFEFEDPWTGLVVSPCHFAQDVFTDRIGSENSESVSLTILEA